MIEASTAKAIPPGGDEVLAEVRGFIAEARQHTARMVDASLTLLYWRVGDRIRREILQESRAQYGSEIVSALGRQLEQEFGRGFSAKSLRHMIRFAEAFPSVEIVSALRRQLSWTHFKALIYLEEPLKREFYAEMCRIEGWSTRTLQERIQSMLYERTALSKKPAKLIEQELQALREQDQLTPDLVFEMSRDDQSVFDSFFNSRVRRKTGSVALSLSRLACSFERIIVSNPKILT